MSDEYLWDRSGPPDPDVERLERMLGRLRSTPPVPQLPPRATGVRTARYVAPLLTAAAVIALMIGSTWRSTRGGSFEVARLDGEPRIESTALSGAGRIAVGQTLVTNAASRARVSVSTIGNVTIDPNSRLRLVDTRDGRHQLALDRGTLHASITAPPGQLIVDTPSARATDLGCEYTLHVDEGGTGVIGVTAGWVPFDRNGL